MSDRPASIAILPFESLSGSAADGRLAVGFVQDLVAELARFPSVGVIAAESVFATRAVDGDGQDVGRRLGVEFVLEGSVRRSERSLRIGVRLVRAASGELLWAERYDVPADGLFEVQDEIAAKVANALTRRIDQAVLRATRKRKLTSLAAYECWLLGMESLQRGTLEADAEARKFFEQALAIDPQSARAHAGISLSHFNEWSCQAWNCWGEKEKAAYEWAERAEALDPEDPLVQMILGKIEQYRRRHERAEAHYHRAAELAPNDAFVAIQLALGFALLGDPERGEERAGRALELNPLCPSWWHYYASLPRFVRGDDEGAVASGSKAPALATDGPAFLAASHAHLGQVDRARSWLEEFDRVFRERITPGREPEPGEAVRWLRHVNPFRRDADLDRLVEGLRIAGLKASAVPRRRPSPPATVEWPVGNVFRREGALWMVCFEHRVAHVPGLRGFEDISRLLARPREEVHCAELAGPPGRVDRGAEVLDERGRRAYRARLAEIEADLAEAEEANDPGRASQLAEEKEQLLDELRKATGLGGRSRRMADGVERARSAVTWRIRHAIRKLEPAHSTLARHLSHSIRTGVFCSYVPEKETEWYV